LVEPVELVEPLLDPEYILSRLPRKNVMSVVSKKLVRHVRCASNL
ncbi:MAG: hypothetical protein ACI83E_002528, partial [Sulfitobacter sp.]